MFIINHVKQVWGSISILCFAFRIIYFWCLSLLYFQLDVLCHVKSNFIADWVLGFLRHLFAFSGSPWQTGSDSLFESSSGDFHKTGTMLTGCFYLLFFSPFYLIFVFVCPTKNSYTNITFLISFYQTQNFRMFKLFSECLLYKFQSTMEVAVAGPFQGFDDIRKLSLKSAIRRLL